MVEVYCNNCKHKINNIFTSGCKADYEIDYNGDKHYKSCMLKNNNKNCKDFEQKKYILFNIFKKPIKQKDAIEEKISFSVEEVGTFGGDNKKGYIKLETFFREDMLRKYKGVKYVTLTIEEN